MVVLADGPGLAECHAKTNSFSRAMSDFVSLAFEPSYANLLYIYKKKGKRHALKSALCYGAAFSCHECGQSVIRLSQEARNLLYC